MPKVLITEPCLINHRDDRGGVHNDAGEIVTVAKDTAVDLARMGRVLFIDKADDPTKAGTLTASKEMLAAAADMRKAREKGAAAAKSGEGDGNTQL